MLKINLKKLFLNLFYSKVFAVIILCLWGIIIYSNTFNSPFCFDGVVSIVNSSHVRDISNLWAIWNFWPTRFITYLSFALNYHFHQLNVFGYHLFNLFVHLISAILVWWFVLLTFSTPLIKDKQIAKQANLIALFSGLIFLTHPLQTEAVTYIVQRATSLASLFYLFSLSLYVKARLLQQEGREKRVLRYFYFGCLLSAIMAVFTKEIAITLPLSVLLYEHCFLRTNREIKWKNIIPFLIIAAVIPFLLFLKKPITFTDIEALINKPLTGGHYFLTQLRVMLTYIRLTFIPINQNLDYDYPIVKTLFDLSVLASILFLVIILIITVRIFSKHRLLSFAIFWFFITLLPESSIIPLKDVIFEHRLYLPMLGYSLFLTCFLYYLFCKNTIKPMLIIMLMIISIYSILTYARNSVWMDNVILWNDTVRKSPHKARPYNNRGVAYQGLGNLDQAFSDYNKAIELNPDFDAAYNNRGMIYEAQGNLDQAFSDYNKAIELNSNNALAYSNRAIIYFLKQEYSKAWQDVRKSEALGYKIHPDFLEALNNAPEDKDKK